MTVGKNTMPLLCSNCGNNLNPEARCYWVSNFNPSMDSICLECCSDSRRFREYWNKLRARDSVHHPRKAFVWTLRSDSMVWMEIAEANYDFHDTTWHGTSKSNIALTSAGLALETAYKALLLADGRSQYGGEKQPFKQDMPYKHSIEELHVRLRKDRKAAIDSAIRSKFRGKNRPALESYFRFMDEYVNHTYRKYWFMGASTVGGFAVGLMQTIQTVHQALMEQVEKAWDELQSEYSAATNELIVLADRLPNVYKSYESTLTDAEEVMIQNSSH